MRPEEVLREHHQAQGEGGRSPCDHWMAGGPLRPPAHPGLQAGAHEKESLPVPWQQISAKNLKPRAFFV